MINKPIYSWSDINWKQVKSTVKNMRSEIFLAKRQGNLIKVRYLQNRILKSKSNLLLAINQITSIHQGIYKEKQIYLTPKKKLALFYELSQQCLLKWNPPSIQRKNVSKTNRTRRQSIGISMISDRVIQLVYKNSLEPEWEAIFEHSSYGFRPSRNKQDAMIRTYKVISKKKRIWILKGDIEGFFSNINTRILFNKIGDVPGKEVIKKWLKPQYIEGFHFSFKFEKTTNDLIIHPLLANITLHGLETKLNIRYHKNGYVRSECANLIIRYASDFIILNKTEENSKAARNLITEALKEIGLKFSKEQILITNTRNGFDFLGFYFKIYADKRKRFDKVTLVIPSNENKIQIKTDLKKIWRSSVGHQTISLIKKLNDYSVKVINDYRHINANSFFRYLDHFNYLQAVRYIRRSHTNKSWNWLIQTYFTTKNYSKWTFYDRNTGTCLIKFKNIKIKYYIPVKFGACYDDPEWGSYFRTRNLDELKLKYQTRPSFMKILKRQAYICPVCQESLKDINLEFETLDIHHLKHKSQKGKDTYDNLIICHSTCHRVAHSLKFNKSILIKNLIKQLKIEKDDNQINKKEFEKIKSYYLDIESVK